MGKPNEGPKSQHLIQFTGFHPDFKDGFKEIVEKLGGKVCDKTEFDKDCTHLIVRKPNKSEKFYCALATGKWILTKAFIDESKKKGHWVDEAKYEWNEDKVNTKISSKSTLEVCAAPGKWRSRCQNGGGKPFDAWKTAVFASTSGRKHTFKRLLEYGGATVSNFSKPLRRPEELVRNLTHLIVDDECVSDVQGVIDLGLPCLRPEFIGDYLVKDPLPDPVSYLAGTPLKKMPLRIAIMIRKACGPIIGNVPPPAAESTISEASTTDSLKDFEDRPPSSWKEAGRRSQAQGSRSKSAALPGQDSSSARPNPGKTLDEKSATELDSSRESQNPVVSSLKVPQILIRRISEEEIQSHQSPVPKIKGELQVKDSPGKLSSSQSSVDSATSGVKKSERIRRSAALKDLAGQNCVPADPATPASSSQRAATPVVSDSAEMKRGRPKKDGKGKLVPGQRSITSMFASQGKKTRATSSAPDTAENTTTDLKNDTTKAGGNPTKSPRHSPKALEQKSVPQRVTRSSPAKAASVSSAKSQNPKRAASSVTSSPSNGSSKPTTRSRNVTKAPEVAVKEESSKEMKPPSSTASPAAKVPRSVKRVLNMDEAGERRSTRQGSSSSSQPIKSYKSPSNSGGSVATPPLKQPSHKRKHALQNNGPKLKKRKLYHQDNIPWTPSTHHLPLTLAASTPGQNNTKQSFPMSEPMACVFDTCIDENRQHYAVDVMFSLNSRKRHPQSKTLRTLMTEILQPSNEPYLSEKVSAFLNCSLAQHPPVTATLQTMYRETLLNPKQLNPGPREEWEYLEKVISQCTIPAEDVEESYAKQMMYNNFLLLKYLVAVFEKDFSIYAHRLKNAYGSPTQSKIPLIAQVVWPHGKPGTMNRQCRSLIAHFMDTLRCDHKHKVELVKLVQSLISMVAACMNLSQKTLLTAPTDFNLPDNAFLFAKEIAYRVGADIEDSEILDLFCQTIQPPWLGVLVMQTLLDAYEMFIPVIEENDVISLKKIVSKYFYLLPRLATGQSPRKRLKQNSSQSSQPSRSRGQNDSQVSTPGPISSPRFKQSPTQDRNIARLNKTNHLGETQLIIACKKNNVLKVKDLLSNPGIRVNVKDNAGWTALHEACNHGYIECVRELLKYRPHRTIITSYFDSSDDCGKVNMLSTNMDGITPLHDSALNNTLEVAELLLQYGGKALLDAKTKLGKTPEDLAVSQQMKDLLANFRKSNPNVTPSKSINSLGMNSPGYDSSQNSLPSSQSSTTPGTTYQPTPDMYDTILGVGSERDHVPEHECIKYILLVYHLLKNYMAMKHYCSTKIFLNSGLGTKSELIRSICSKAFDAQRAEHESKLATKKSWPSEPAAEDSSSTKRATRSRTAQDESLLAGSPVPKRYKEDLKEELHVLRKLGRHAHGFKTYIENISLHGNIDWSKTKMQHILFLARN